MLTTWRADGYGRDVLELWVVGRPGQEAEVPTLGAGDDCAVFVDVTEPTSSAFTAYSAINDDLFVIDSPGNVAHETNLAAETLYVDTNRDALDALVRALLGPP